MPAVRSASRVAGQAPRADAPAAAGAGQAEQLAGCGSTAAAAASRAGRSSSSCGARTRRGRSAASRRSRARPGRRGPSRSRRRRGHVVARVEDALGRRRRRRQVDAGGARRAAPRATAAPSARAASSRRWRASAEQARRGGRRSPAGARAAARGAAPRSGSAARAASTSIRAIRSPSASTTGSRRRMTPRPRRISSALACRSSPSAAKRARARSRARRRGPMACDRDVEDPRDGAGRRTGARSCSSGGARPPRPEERLHVVRGRRPRGPGRGVPRRAILGRWSAPAVTTSSSLEVERPRLRRRGRRPPRRLRGLLPRHRARRPGARARHQGPPALRRGRPRGGAAPRARPRRRALPLRPALRRLPPAARRLRRRPRRQARPGGRAPGAHRPPGGHRGARARPGASSVYGYRNKMEYSAAPGPRTAASRSGSTRAGAGTRWSTCAACLLATPLGNAVRESGARAGPPREALAPYDQRAQAGDLRHVVVREGVATGQVLVTRGHRARGRGARWTGWPAPLAGPPRGGGPAARGERRAWRR